MQAVILAAGEGKRLRPLTGSRPKSLIPVANRPIIEHVIRSLVSAGVRDIIVVAGYRKEQVIRHLNTLDIPVKVVEQKRQLGTAHALMCAKDLIKENFLVLPGDNYIDQISVANIMKQPDSLLITEHKNPSNFGVVSTSNGYITDIVEKPENATRFTVSCGIYHFNVDMVKHIKFRTLTEELSAYIEKGRKIHAVNAINWRDAIYPWDLIHLNNRLLEQVKTGRSGKISSGAQISGRVYIGKGSTVGPFTTITGPVVIGENCDIGSHCCIGPNTSIGSQVSIEPFSLVQKSLIMSDTVVGSHSHLKNAVTGEGCTLSEHTMVCTREGIHELDEKLIKTGFGVIMGDSVYSGQFVVYENSIIGNDSVVEGGKTIISSRIIPDKSRVM